MPGGNFVLGETIVQPWTVLDLADAPLTGITTPAGIVFTLHRQSGALMIPATETITWTEDVGSAGNYSISFTPANLGLYELQLHELSVLTGQRWFAFSYSILSAGAVFLPSYTNAFCAESDIERWVQMSIDSTTAPSATATAGFAEARAAMLMSMMARWGLAVTPSTVTAGSRLEDLLREANAIGAALDFTIAQTYGHSPSATDRPDWLDRLWKMYYGDAENEIIGIIELEVRGNLASLATDHILSGDTLADPGESTAPYNLPIGITMGDTF